MTSGRTRTNADMSGLSASGRTRTLSYRSVRCPGGCPGVSGGQGVSAGLVPMPGARLGGGVSGGRGKPFALRAHSAFRCMAWSAVSIPFSLPSKYSLSLVRLAPKTTWLSYTSSARTMSAVFVSSMASRASMTTLSSSSPRSPKSCDKLGETGRLISGWWTRALSGSFSPFRNNLTRSRKNFSSEIAIERTASRLTRSSSSCCRRLCRPFARMEIITPMKPSMPTAKVAIALWNSIRSSIQFITARPLVAP